MNSTIYIYFFFGVRHRLSLSLSQRYCLFRLAWNESISKTLYHIAAHSKSFFRTTKLSIKYWHSIAFYYDPVPHVPLPIFFPKCFPRPRPRLCLFSMLCREVDFNHCYIWSCWLHCFVDLFTGLVWKIIFLPFSWN